MMMRWASLPVLLGVLLVPGISAQRVRTAEAQALRDAGTHEARGRLVEAEAVLKELLEQEPTSAGGLFALERVLRSQGRVAGRAACRRSLSFLLFPMPAGCAT